MTNSNEYSAEEGCESSIADAIHDFHDIFKRDLIINYVQHNIPEYQGLVCNELSEDRFIDKYELNLAERDTSATHKSEKDFIVKHLNENISNRYAAYYIERPQRSYNNQDMKFSKLQQCFNDAGISTDVFFICDVAYSNVREDLKFADPNNSQTFYWVQNAQTLYDPAGKTTWHSDKSYFEDEDGDPTSSSSTTRINAPNHFKMEGSKFVFCWQNAKTDIVTYYPEWSKNLFPNKEATYKFSTNQPDQMLYTNKNLFLSIKSENINDYASQEAYLIITDPSKPGYYGYADKVLAAKGSGILKAADLASYRAKGNELKRFVKFINDNVNWSNDITGPSAPRIQLFLDEVMNYSSYFQVLAKKVGDASQSLSCCQKAIQLQKFVNNVFGPKMDNNIIDFTSNGNHAFVSFDRIAIGCALNFNTPIVVGNTQEGFIVYIRKDLMNVHRQFDTFFKKNNDEPTGVYQLFNTLKVDPASASFILDESLYANISSTSSRVKENMIHACLNLNLSPSSDITYQNFMINHFAELNVLQLFSNLNLDVLNFNSDNFNVKIKQIYNDKLQTILQKCQTLQLTDFADLTDIQSLSNINDLINGIVVNCTKIIDKLNSYYSEFTGTDDTSSYSNENPKHEKYKNLLLVLREIEKIIVEINEIQKLLKSNLSAMEKLNYYQEDIDRINENPANNNESKINENVKNLPKGIATNITSYTPFTYYLVNNRTVRNSDIFFERSTSIFGTTTIILQIFNTLNCEPLDKLKKRFVKIIFNLLNELTEKASALNNVSFVTIINSAKQQFNDLLIVEPEEAVVTIDESNINQLINLIPSTPPPERPPTIQASQTDTVDEVEELAIKTILKNKKLIITKSASDLTNFRMRIDTIRNLNKKDFKNLFNLVTSGRVDRETMDSNIKIAYENEIFIKGFIGLFAFMKYIEINTEKRIPVLFTARSTGNQENILERLFGFLYLNINDNKKDINILEELRVLQTDIRNRIPSIDFARYRGLTNSEERVAYISSLITNSNLNIRLTGSLFTTIIANLEKYVNYSIQTEGALGLYREIDTLDANPPIDKSDFSVGSFKKLLEMNVITVDSKPLTGKYSGVNSDEINANMALLYFIENRIAALNKEPLPHPELVGLFSQIFKETGLNPQEYITENALRRGGGDGLFDVMYDLFVDNDDTEFKAYRKNSYLLLNMPNIYEIEMKNFQAYPYEIRMLLQELNREYEQEQGQNNNGNLGNLGKGVQPLTNFNDRFNNVPNINPLKQVEVFGGKLKMVKTKRMKKNKHRNTKNTNSKRKNTNSKTKNKRNTRKNKRKINKTKLNKNK